MDEQKKSSPEIVVRGKFFRWIDNFWFHYKWIVIGVTAALIILLVCILQTCSTEKEDTLIVYAGPRYLSVSETDQLNQVMSTLMPYDFDKDGTKRVHMNMFEIYSEEQIRAITAETDAAGQAGYVDRVRNQSQHENYVTHQQTGESSVYFLDPSLYAVLGNEYFCPLSDSVGSLPEGALEDGYGVRLGDTALYREYAVMRLLPEDTVICLMNPLVWGKSSNEENYQFQKDMFRAIVTFEGSGEQTEES